MMISRAKRNYISNNWSFYKSWIRMNEKFSEKLRLFAIFYDIKNVFRS